MFDFVLLWNCVGDHDSLKVGIVDPRNGRPREDTVSQDGVDFSGSCRHQSDKGQRRTYAVKTQTGLYGGMTDY